jgi:DNA-binding response OmpR family regulator
MKKRVDPVGRLLLRAAVLDEETLQDVLDQQRHTLPFASLCYILGHAEEEPLTRALSKHTGVPGMVLSRCVINLAALSDLPRDIAQRQAILPVLEDDSRIFVAVEDPANVQVIRELGFIKGKAIVPHIALAITIQRSIRLAYAARERGERYFYGEKVTVREGEGSPGRMWVVSDVDELPSDITGHSMRDTEPGDITKELADDEDPEDDFSTARGDQRTAPAASVAGAQIDPHLAEDQRDTATNQSGVAFDLDYESASQARQQVVTPEPGVAPSTPRVLVVDSDFATRHILGKVLVGDGYQVDTAASGMEAIKRLRAGPPDLVMLEVLLPEIDGYHICRSIKTSRKYSHIPVILMSSDPQRVAPDMLTRYGADASFEKPLPTDRLSATVAELLGARGEQQPAIEDRSFERSIEMYRAGKIDEAIDTLRTGLAHDPLSTKHHFVLANLLQKKNLIYEAIDEYEATVNLKPDYFPALSRLAYLYYKKGFSAKAIDTWRRSLPHCTDQALRQNIEVFMRKLITDMSRG